MQICVFLPYVGADLGTLLYFRRELLFLLHSKKSFPLRSIPPLQRKGGAKIPPPLHSFSHLLVFNTDMKMWQNAQFSSLPTQSNLGMIPQNLFIGLKEKFTPPEQQQGNVTTAISPSCHGVERKLN